MKKHVSFIIYYLFLALPLSDNKNATTSNMTELMENRKGSHATNIKSIPSVNDEGYFTEGVDDYDNNIGNKIMDYSAYSRQSYDNDEYVDIGDGLNLPDRIPFLPGVPRSIPYYGDYSDENERDFRDSEYENPDYFRNSPPHRPKPNSNLNPPHRPGFPYREVYHLSRERNPEEHDYARGQEEEDRYPPEYDDYGEESRRPQKNSFEEESEGHNHFRSPAPSENQVGFFDYFDNEDAYVTTPSNDVGQPYRTINHDNQADLQGYERNYKKNVNDGFQYPIYKKITNKNPNNPYGYTSYNHRLYQKNIESNIEY